MYKTNGWKPVSTIATSLVLIGLAAAPAAANMRHFDDPVGDTKAHNDIKWVEVANGGATGKHLVVRVKLGEIEPGDGERIFVDTRAKDPGPEWRMLGWADSEWRLERVENWDSPGTVVACPGRVSLTDNRTVGFWRTRRACLGVGDKVRVSVRMQEDTSPQHDWAAGYRTFLGWVNH